MQCIACCQGKTICNQEIGSLLGVAQECIGAGQWRDSNSTAGVSAAVHTCDTVALAKGELHVVDVSHHCKITCVQGALWITAANRSCDYILKTGECMQLQGKGKIIISSGGTNGLFRISHS